MLDFKAHFNIVKCVAQQAAKEMHKPSLCNKASMAAYAQAIGASGKKASFTLEQKSDMIEWSV